MRIWVTDSLMRQEEASKRTQDLNKETNELMGTRRAYITRMMELVHPITIDDEEDPKEDKGILRTQGIHVVENLYQIISLYIHYCIYSSRS